MTLEEAIDCYIEEKQQRGFLYRSAGGELRAFGRYFPEYDLSDVTGENLSEFLSKQGSTYLWRRKCNLLKCFFRHWQVRGVISQIELPPPRAFVKSSFRPYVYSHAEVRNLVHGTQRLVAEPLASVDREVFRTLLLVLYGTGMRLGEALSLRVEDIDLIAGSITIQTSGTQHRRTIWISVDMLDELRHHINLATSRHVSAHTLFHNKQGGEVSRDALYCMFRNLLRITNVQRRDRIEARPRLSDLRTTFAVHQITSWIRAGKDLNRLLPALSHHLGKLDLTASEPLLRLTPERFKKELDKLSPSSGLPWREDQTFMRSISSLLGTGSLSGKSM